MPLHHVPLQNAVQRAPHAERVSPCSYAWCPEIKNGVPKTQIGKGIASWANASVLKSAPRPRADLNSDRWISEPRVLTVAPRGRVASPRTLNRAKNSQENPLAPPSKKQWASPPPPS